MYKHVGIHRGVVIDNRDPLGKGRVRISIDGMPGTNVWAMPCRAPGSTVLPAAGAGVWVMFERGELDSPVWLGVWE